MYRYVIQDELDRICEIDTMIGQPNSSMSDLLSRDMEEHPLIDISINMRQKYQEIRYNDFEYEPSVKGQMMQTFTYNQYDDRPFLSK